MPDAASLREAWQGCVAGLLARATLRLPEDGWMQSGGRRGVHSEHLGHLLAELQVLPRTYPGAQW
jgi:ring-1,2-phenylacetyl-CoA epoxidase subunit PaaC